ncbi:hypothetical protein D047_0619A, partial [Vibrio parahaemolyticus VPTS-2010_2]
MLRKVSRHHGPEPIHTEAAHLHSLA